MSLDSEAKTLHESRRPMYDASDRYRRTFVDEATGLIDAKYTETRPCPVCTADEPRPVLVKNGGSYVKCGRCDMVYINPVFREQELRKYYENNHAAQAAATANEGDFYRRIYAKGLDAIGSRVKPGAILDLGCSSGFFLDLARAASWQTYGVELNRAEYAMARAREHTVYDVPIEEVRLPVKMQAITMWDVFEHIRDGGAYLGFLRGLLAPDGVIFLQIPSADALAARVLQEKCNMFDGIEHVNLYAPRTIRTLCDRIGFDVLHLETVITELQVLRKYLDYENPYFSDRPGAADLPFLTEDFVHGALLGYKMQIVLMPRK